MCRKSFCVKILCRPVRRVTFPCWVGCYRRNIDFKIEITTLFQCSAFKIRSKRTGESTLQVFHYCNFKYTLDELFAIHIARVKVLTKG